MRFLTTILIGVAFPLGLMAQAITVYGIADQDTTPLSDASILVKPIGEDATPNALLTDADGQAQFAHAHQTIAIQVRMIGFRSVTDTLQANESLSIYLQSSGMSTDPVVVTGQMEALRAEQAIHNVRVIDRQRIEAMSAVTARDLLTQELNIRISQDNILGSVMSMQGLGGENVKILIDGVPVVGRQGGNVDLGQLNLNDIERVEIIEGPMAVNYGADALGGVINLITKKNQREPIDAGVSYYAETIGHQNVNGHVGIRKGQHTLRASGGRNFFGGWSPDGSTTERGDQWNPREQLLASLLYGLHLNKGQLRYRGSGFDETISNFGTPNTTPYSIYAYDDYYRTRRLDNEVQADFRLGNWQLNGVASYKIYHRLKNTYRKDLHTLEENLTPSASDQDTTRFDLYFSRGTAAWLPTNQPIKVQMGYEVSHEIGEGDRIDAGTQTQGDFAGFGNLEYSPIRQLKLRGGVRWGYNTAYDMPLAPAFHLRYRFHPNFTLRAAYARGFRAPSLREQYLFFVDINHNIQGNSDLLAETSHNVNGSLKYRKILTNGVLRVGAYGFFNHVDDLITLALRDPETQLYAYINIGERETMGSRLEVSYQTERMNIQVGGTYNAISNTLAAQEGGEAVPTYSFSPEAKATLQYLVPVLETRLSLFYKYNGQMPQFVIDANDEIAEGFIEDYHTIDVTVQKAFWNNRFRANLGVRNLADVQNINTMASGTAHSGGGSMAIATGRAYFLRLSLKY